MLAKFSSFDLLLTATLRTLKPNSRRVYEQTYGRWMDWCHNNDFDPLNLHPDNLHAFLITQHVTKTTRQRQYSSMKKLLQVMALTSDDARKAYEYLKLVPMPEDNLSDNERDTSVLSPEQIDRLVNVFNGETAVLKRNAALVWVLVATAMRRSEVVALKWNDVDLDRESINVRHGKGDKRRTVVIVYDRAVVALKAWRTINDGQYVFRPLTNLNEFVSDSPMTDDNLYRIILMLKKKTGIYLTPHTLRRTFATELIANGASVADVQEQLGHAKASTLLDHYVKAANAQQRRTRFKKSMGGAV